MDFAKIRPRGGTKAQWEKANPVLAKREIGVQWETTIGVGEVVIKIGDGVNNWINLPEAVKSDITKKIIAALAVVPDDDPDLADGDSLDTLFGKIAKKFKYLKDNKLDKSARYDGTDSTSTELVPTANALRGVNAKADKNASDITTLNNNLSKRLLVGDNIASADLLNDNPAERFASGTKAAVFEDYIKITNLKLYAGHTYLVLGKTESSISVSLISARVVSPSPEYGSAFDFLESRTTGSNGGGCVTAAIMTLTKDYTVSLQGYGYDNATYNYSGFLMAIQLK